MLERILNNHRLCLIFGVAFLANGCAPMTLDRNTQKPIPIQLRVDDAAYWLDEWYRAIQLPVDQYQAALDAREAGFTKNPGPRTRLRLVLLLAEGKPAGLDRPRALALIKGLEPSATNSAKALALLLENKLTSQKTVKISKAPRRKSKAAEENSKDSGEMDLNMDLKAAKLRIKELEQQLHDITAIEQNIQERANQ